MNPTPTDSSRQLHELLAGLSAQRPASSPEPTLPPVAPIEGSSAASAPAGEPLPEGAGGPAGSGPGPAGAGQPKRSRRGLLVAAVAVPIGLAAAGGGAYLLTRDPADGASGGPQQPGPGGQPGPAGPTEKAGDWRTTQGSKASVDAPQVVAGRRTGTSQRGSTEDLQGEVTTTQAGDTVTVQRARIVTVLPAGAGDAIFELAAPFNVPAAGGRTSARGLLSVRKTVKQVDLPVEVKFPAPGRMEWHTTTAIKFSDYGVKPPSLGGAIGLADEANVIIDPVFAK